MNESEEANGDTDQHWKGQKAGLEDQIEMNAEQISKFDLYRRAPDFSSRNFTYCNTTRPGNHFTQISHNSSLTKPCELTITRALATQKATLCEKNLSKIAESRKISIITI